MKMVATLFSVEVGSVVMLKVRVKVVALLSFWLTRVLWMFSDVFIVCKK